MTRQDEASAVDLEVVKAHVDELRKLFDSVQIFCTRSEGSHGTISAIYGSGDWYARYGLSSMWVRRQDLNVRESSEPEEDNS